MGCGESSSLDHQSIILQVEVEGENVYRMMRSVVDLTSRRAEMPLRTTGQHGEFKPCTTRKQQCVHFLDEQTQDSDEEKHQKS